MYTISSAFLTAVRISIALVWLYQGLWLKIVAADAHHLEIVRQVGFTSPLLAMRLIGVGETLLGIGVLSGFYPRAVAALQIAIILAMNVTGILFGGGSIPDPAGLLIGNLPLLLCIALTGLVQRSPAPSPGA